ncbi:CIC11C00000000725 [Sungouiella intermedia]|uniref:glucan endo-1,3-beta-D-glucosidase n=1 Tax=Sungouiella intermedia TaxID=45354 RepID=A0A1L0BWC9_9ASCO|nr:CIC11C00000000725 [[Candida] intermedia]
MRFLSTAALSLLAAFVAAEEDFTVTVTNYVTAPCFASAIKSVDNGKAAVLGIPVVMVWGDAKVPSSITTPTTTEGAAIESDDVTFTVTEYSTEFLTTEVPCTVTDYITTQTTITTCVDYDCRRVVTTTLCPTTYVTTVKSIYPVSSKVVTESVSTLIATGTGSKQSGVSVSKQTGNSGVENCTKCKVLTLLLTYEITSTSVIFSATETPALSKPTSSEASVSHTGSNPLYTELAVTTGSVISASGSLDLSSLLADTSSTLRATSDISSLLTGTSATAKPTSGFSSLELSLFGYSNATLAIPSSSSVSSGSSSVSSSSSTTQESTLTLSSTPTCHSVVDLFAEISTEDPTKYFAAGELPLAIPDGVTNTLPFQTNKFYANLFLENQDQEVWTFPYGVFWDKTNKYGFAVQHTDSEDKTYGPENANGAASYYYNNPRVGDLVFSASNIGKNANSIEVSDMTEFSAKVTLSDGLSTSSYIEFPLVKGMGFFTAIYHGESTLRISSFNAITLLTQILPSDRNQLVYRVTLNSGISWLLFVTLPSSSTEFSLKIENGEIFGDRNLDGVIVQAAVAPSTTSLIPVYAAAAGQYVTSAKVVGALDCTSASYSFKYTSSGSSSAGVPLLFALPHHLQTLDDNVLNRFTGIQLDSTTKGKMSAFLTNSFDFKETINNNIQFLPWTQDVGTSPITYSASQIKKIYAAAVAELNGVDVAATILQLQSLYYMGKLVDKYAYILLTLNDIVKDEDLTKLLLSALKSFFSELSLNHITYPLMYDTKFHGVTSTANNKGDTGAEFGSGYYNDHHFHYGYIVHAAAIVGYVDKLLGGSWAEDNKGWVNALIRDVANPSTSDPYFPVSRLFDWFHGHSYAKGLFASADGKDEESSSEDYNFSYGMKLWGNVIGDNAMEARGDLILKIQSRSMNDYFLYSSDNTIEPSNFIANKVSGIYFDNKIDYNTYFGSNTEFIHGIHMLPITPASSLIRGPGYVSEEWSAIIGKIINSVNSGWTGILRLNQALFDGSSSYDFFSSRSFSAKYLDGGQSLTWSLAFSAAIANAA